MRTWERVAMYAVLAAGASLRLFRLGFQSEWNDEALSVVIAKASTTQILGNQFQSLHPPGYYLLLHWWLKAVGDSDTALRLLSAFLGILGIATVYTLAARLFKTTTGLWAAAVTAIMPFHLFYSQEVRMYSLLFLLSALAMLMLTWLNKPGQPAARWLLLYLVVGMAGLYTHYLFGLILVTLGLYLLIGALRRRDSPRVRALVLLHVAMIVFYAPMYFWIREQWGVSSDYWIASVSLAGFLSLPLSFTVGQFLSSAQLMIAYGLILALIIITMLQAARTVIREPDVASRLGLVLAGYWLPVTVLFLVSLLWTPLTLPRLMIVAVPALYVLLAWGASMTKERIANAVLIVPLGILALVADRNWLLDSRFQKPPAREAAMLLAEKSDEGVAIIYANDSGFRLFSRYAPQLDNRLYLDANIINNPQVRPEVIRLMGGTITTADELQTDDFWLVLHQDFEVAEQEEIFRRFEHQYERISGQEINGIRLYHYRGSSD